MSVPPNYERIGNNYDRWYECVSLLKETSFEHRQKYREDLAEPNTHGGHMQAGWLEMLQAKEETNYLRVWYVPKPGTIGADTEIEFVAFFQRMKALSKELETGLTQADIKLGKAEAWAISIGFKQSAIPRISYEPDPIEDTRYQTILKDYLETRKGLAGGGLTPKVTGTLGYFLKHVVGKHNGHTIDAMYSVGLKTLYDASQAVGYNPNGQKISRLENVAEAFYPEASSGEEYWKVIKQPVKGVPNAYQQYPWGVDNDNVPHDCVVRKIALNHPSPAGP